MQDVSNYKLSSFFATMVVVTIVIICMCLARWQWQRAESKIQLIAQEQAHSMHSSIQTEELLNLTQEHIHGAKGQVSGFFHPSHMWFLDNQVVGGVTGYDLIGLLHVKGLNKYLIVNLGFVAAPQTRTLPSVRLPEHEVSLDVQIKSKNLKGFTLATSPAMSTQHENLLQYLDLAYFTNQTRLVIYPFIAHQIGHTVDIATPHFQLVVMSPQKHQAYALQWLLIGLAAAFVGYFLHKRKEL